MAVAGENTRLGRCQCGCGREVRLHVAAPWARAPECHKGRDDRLEAKREFYRQSQKKLIAARPLSRLCRSPR